MEIDFEPTPHEEAVALIKGNNAVSTSRKSAITVTTIAINEVVVVAGFWESFDAISTSCKSAIVVAAITIGYIGVVASLSPISEAIATTL